MQWLNSYENNLIKMQTKGINLSLSPTDAKRIRRGFDDMSKKLQKNMLRDMRKAARPLKAAMKAEAPERSKTLRKSIVVKSTKFNSNFDVRVGPRIKGSKNDAWYSHFVELGTSGGKGGATGVGQEANNFIERSYSSTVNVVSQSIITAIKSYIKFR